MFTNRLTRSLGAGSMALMALAASPAAASAAENNSRGAPFKDLLWANLVGLVGSILLVWFGYRHRTGKGTVLHKAARLASKATGLPGWSALPALFAGIALLFGGVGFIWDVGTHLDAGRDSGPFANNSHYLIIIGLVSILLAGVVAALIGTNREENPTAVKITDNWYMPLGGLVVLLCGGIALTGFPLDDVWHRLFGQDVTLLGPTHIIMIGGGSLTTLGIWLLLEEGVRTKRLAKGRAEAAAATAADAGTSDPGSLPGEGTMGRLSIHIGQILNVETVLPGRIKEVLAHAALVTGQLIIAGSFFISLSTLQGEYDFGVPQFRLLVQPMMLMLAAGVGLVAVRVRLGRGSAIVAILIYLLARSVITVVVGPVLGHTTMHFPLYLAEAILVELVALKIKSYRRPVAFGVWSGVLIGTVGLAAEWGWSHLWMPLPWPATDLPEIFTLGLLTAVSGGIIGGLIGRALLPEYIPRQRVGRVIPLAAGLVLAACVAYPLYMTPFGDVKATISLKDVRVGTDREVAATIKLDPPDAAKDASWFYAMSFQGGDKTVIDKLRKVGPGTYETTKPLKAYGEWKTVLRLHQARGLQAVPIYLPGDPGIPVAGIAAPRSEFTRAFVEDKTILRREEVGGTDAMRTFGYLFLLVLSIAWIGVIAFALSRFESIGRSESSPRPPGPKSQMSAKPASTPATT